MDTGFRAILRQVCSFADALIQIAHCFMEFGQILSVGLRVGWGFWE